MTARKILEAIAIYRRYFNDRGLGKVDFPHDETTAGFEDRDSIFEHCHGMLYPLNYEMPNEKASFRSFLQIRVENPL